MKTTRTFTILAVITASTLASTGIASAQTPSSGMLLGIYAFENWRGLRVTETMPGYSAHGRLFPNDVLIQVADGNLVYSARRRHEFEAAKDQIGPNRWVAIEVFRPSVGMIYFWVQFTPVMGPTGPGPLAYSQGVSPGYGGQPAASPAAAGGQPMVAQFKTEKERGMAAAPLFNRSNRGNAGPPSAVSNPNPGRPDGNPSFGGASGFQPGGQPAVQPSIQPSPIRSLFQGQGSRRSLFDR